MKLEPGTSTPRMVPLSHSAASYPPPLVATLYMPLLKKLVLVLWCGRETKAEPEPNPNANVMFAW